MKEHIYFEDITKGERKLLVRAAFKSDKATQAWSALAIGLSVLLGSVLSSVAFPDKSDWPGQAILGVVLCSGLAALLHEAVVKPRIIRRVERQLNS